MHSRGILAILFSILVYGPAIGPAIGAEDRPTAIVENVSSTVKSVQFLEYLRAGQIINLTSESKLVIGYLPSCIREIITGGRVTIGIRQSVVSGGKVARERVECDGGNLQNLGHRKTGSAVTVFRAKPGEKSKLPKSQLTLYSTSPMVSLSHPTDNIKIVRLDKLAKSITLPANGLSADFVKHNVNLSPGGLYQINASGKSLVFSIDPLAEDKNSTLLQRLIHL